MSCIFKKNSSSAQSIFCLLSTEINTKFLNFRLTTKPITYSGLTPQSIHCPSTSSRKSHSRPRHWRFNSRKMNGERRTKIPVQWVTGGELFSVRSCEVETLKWASFTLLGWLDYIRPLPLKYHQRFGWRFRVRYEGEENIRLPYLLRYCQF